MNSFVYMIMFRSIIINTLSEQVINYCDESAKLFRYCFDILSSLFYKFILCVTEVLYKF